MRHTVKLKSQSGLSGKNNNTYTEFAVQKSIPEARNIARAYILKCLLQIKTQLNINVAFLPKQ